MSDLKLGLQEHYSRRPILPLIREQLQRKGIDPTQIRPEDLYPYDQSHAGGIAATWQLALRAGIEQSSVVVDIGCGFGGTTRFLRAELGCRVVGVDLTPTRIQTARELTRMVRIEAGIDFLVGSALALPFPSEFADVVWTQHVTMNLPDHAAFVSECARVLRPSGRLASHEWLRQRDGELPSPLPWASTLELNHAIAAREFLDLLKRNHLEPEAEDVTAAMCDALTADIASMESQGALPERTAAFKNLVQAARDGLLCCWMIVSRKP
jgi:ubiquinone/menaquinone biosynthesis C-methylase UbiE